MGLVGTKASPAYTKELRRDDFSAPDFLFGVGSPQTKAPRCVPLAVLIGSWRPDPKARWTDVVKCHRRVKTEHIPPVET